MKIGLTPEKRSNSGDFGGKYFKLHPRISEYLQLHVSGL